MPWEQGCEEREFEGEQGRIKLQSKFQRGTRVSVHFVESFLREARLVG